MILYINTTGDGEMVIAIKDGEKILKQKKIKTDRHQAEKLVPGIARLLALAGIKPNKIKKIIVADRGGSFTSLRIGVITANALAFAWGIPVEGETAGRPKKWFKCASVVEPVYDREPNIGRSKKPAL